MTSLRDGDCFQYPADAAGGSDISQVTAVSCTTPHSAQVIALLPVSASSYPGAGTFQSQGQPGCQAALKSFVDRSKVTSTMSLKYFYPEQQAWDEGQRSISCVVADSSADLTSSVLK